MKKLPFGLIYSWLGIALIIAFITLAKLPQAPVRIAILMAMGLITDIL